MDLTGMDFPYGMSCYERRKKGGSQNKKPEISRQRIIGSEKFRNAVAAGESCGKLKNDGQQYPYYPGQPSFLTGTVFYQSWIHKPRNQEDKAA